MSVEKHPTLRAASHDADGAAHAYDHVIAAAAGDGPLLMPSGASLSGAEFVRAGPDLLLVGPDGTTVLVTGYFTLAAPPALISAEGALLPADLVAILAGPAAPAQYAQEGALVADQPIGRVTDATGAVTATRLDGSQESLEVDSVVFQGDVLETGADAAIAITFLDETVFSIGENARMVLDELVFDPTTLAGRSAFSVLEGVFVFVSGEVAANNPDEMVVRSPVATIGVRGTNVAIQSAPEGDLNTFVLLPKIGEVVSSGAISVMTQAMTFDGTPPIVLSQSYQAASVASVFDVPEVYQAEPEHVAGLLGQLWSALPQAPVVEGIAATIGASLNGDIATFLAQIAPAAGEGADDDDDGTDADETGTGAGAGAGSRDLGLGDAPYDPAFGSGGSDGIIADLFAPDPAPVDYGGIGLVIDGEELLPGSTSETDEEDPLLVDEFLVPNVINVIFVNNLPPAIFESVVLGLGQSALGELSPNEGDFLRQFFRDQPAGDADAFEVSLLGGVHYTAQARGDGAGLFAPGSADFGGTLDDPVLFALDTEENGFQILGEDEDNGTPGFSGNDNSLIDFVPDVDGAYFLQVTSPSEFIGGTFTVSIEESFVTNNLVDPFDGDAAGGTEFDVVHFRAEGEINLEAPWTNIEKIDVAAGGFDNAVFLDPADLAPLTDGGNELIIALNATDSINVGAGWSFVGITPDNLVTLVGPGGETLHVSNGVQLEAELTGGDDIFGGTGGPNIIRGADGNDIITGGPQADELFGDAGNDTLNGGFDQATDRLFGGDGDDTLLVSGDGNDQLFGEAGNDRLEVQNAGFGTKQLFGGAGDDTLIAGPGFDILDGGIGADTLQGNANTTATYASENDVINADLAAGTVNTETGIDQLIGITRIVGTEFGDVIDGSAANDVLIGEDGDDLLNGFGGDDFIEGGFGFNELDGGAGFDIVSYSGAGAMLIDLSENVAFGAGIDDVLFNFEEVIGSAEADDITGNDDALVGDVLDGSEGDDTISGLAGDDVLFGDSGDDTLDGGDGADLILGDDGNDILRGGFGDDELEGGEGDDLLEGGAGDDFLLPGLGTDDIDGGADFDTVLFDEVDGITGVQVNLLAGTIAGGAGGGTISNIEEVIGSFLDDEIIGDDNDNILIGDGGNDELRGLFGDDDLFGGFGDDILDGGDGDDFLNGGFGFNNTASFQDISIDSGGFGATIDLVAGTALADNGDVDALVNIQNVIGSSGDDIILGNGFANLIDGGFGNDEIDGGFGNDVINGGFGSDDLEGGFGFDLAAFDTADFDFVDASLADGLAFQGDDTDTLSGFEGLIGSEFGDFLEGDAGNNELRGIDGADELFGLDGDDRLLGGLGDDDLDGGADSDTADFSDVSLAVIVDLASGTAFGQGDDTLTDIENVIGSTEDDEITGDAGANQLDGNDGDDILDGGLGEDTLRGRAGSDIFLHSGGDDIFDGTGDLFFFEEDTVDYSGLGGSPIFVDLEAGTAEDDDSLDDTLIDIENVIGTGEADQIRGDAQNNELTGGAGDDLLDGRDGFDVLNGGAGNDQVLGGGGGDILNGGAGNDLLDGGTGFNQLFGEAGDDVLDGQQGLGFLDGGAGQDTLLGGNFSDQLDGGAGNDVIQAGGGGDFVIVSRGSDVLDGGDGVDILDARELGLDGLTIDFATGQIVRVGGDDFVDQIANFENVFGTDGGDTIIGDGNANLFLGGLGDDVIAGGGGNDIIIGGAGQNVLTGGAGVDRFEFFGDELAAVADGTVGALAQTTITDFVGDTLAFFGPAFNLGNYFGPLPGFNFRVVEDYDGTNSGVRAQEGHFVFDPNADTLYFDSDSALEGFQSVVTLQDGAVIDATNVQVLPPE